MRYFTAIALLALLSGCAQPIRASRSDTPVVRTAQLYIGAEYDVVWDHFTKPGLYGAWSSAPGLEFSTTPGGRVAWGTSDRAMYEGTLIEATKGQGLSHTFGFTWLEEPKSRVEISILERGPAVLVTLRHDCTQAPRTAEMIGELGWAKSLSRLKTLLESGTAMPWPTEPQPRSGT